METIHEVIPEASAASLLSIVGTLVQVLFFVDCSDFAKCEFGLDELADDCCFTHKCIGTIFLESQILSA